MKPCFHVCELEYWNNIDSICGEATAKLKRENGKQKVERPDG
jgi:hypothetical protein